jgi:hypothetical protein
MYLTCRNRNPEAEWVAIYFSALPQTAPTTFTMARFSPSQPSTKMYYQASWGAEVAGTFLNAKEEVNVRNILNGIGNPQPRTPLITDNLRTFGILSGKMKKTTIEGNRYAFLLAEGLKSPNSIYYVLGSGKTEPW